MRRPCSLIVAMIINAFCVARVLAADLPFCSDCDVASALSGALQQDDQQFTGLRAAGGYWMLSASMDDLDNADIAGPARLHGDASATYLLAARPGILSPEIEDELQLFLQQRAIEDPGNPLGEYVGAGVVYESVAVDGWRKQFAVAFGFAELAAPFQRALSRSGISVAEREAICEVSYRVEVSQRFALQSDVQFIRNPGMDASVDSSWTFGLRFEISAR